MSCNLIFPPGDACNGPEGAFEVKPNYYLEACHKHSRCFREMQILLERGLAMDMVKAMSQAERIVELSKGDRDASRKKV